MYCVNDVKLLIATDGLNRFLSHVESHVWQFQQSKITSEATAGDRIGINRRVNNLATQARQGFQERIVENSAPTAYAQKA